MTMYTEIGMNKKLLEKGDKLRGYGDRILDIKKQMFSMAISTLFKKSDYKGWNASLTSICNEIKQMGIRNTDVKDFADSLVYFAEVLIRVNERLDQKSRGESYPKAEYKDDLYDMGWAERQTYSCETGLWLAETD
jgi:hypothetical protein